ncbi:MAG: ornithine carbamoyltransferase [Candidatus Bipolaricaulia bacterium]
MTVEHLISIWALTPQTVREIIAHASELKAEHRAGRSRRGDLSGKTLAMIFLKPSLRTRVSFETGMTQLGGHALYLGPSDIQLDEREPIEDIAQVTSRYVDGIMARVFAHETVEELAKHATVPVINGLSDRLHPCQALSDLVTIHERNGRLEGLRLAFIGDGNNVAQSLIYGCAKVGIDFVIACPEGFEPEEEIVEAARGEGIRVEIVHDPKEAAVGADVLYTDVWASMGEETIAAEKKRKFAGFQINRELIDLAKDGCLVMHDLPAHYGEEITYEAARSKNSVIYDQAENRLHTQKVILIRLLSR